MKALILFLTLFFASHSAHAANVLASSLMGQVVNADKKPVVGALVLVEQLETGRVLTRYTDKKGRYCALNVRSDGTYRVTVFSPMGRTYSFTGELKLAQDHTRNFVVDFDRENQPAFMRSWRWNMSDAITQQ